MVSKIHICMYKSVRLVTLLRPRVLGSLLKRQSQVCYWLRPRILRSDLRRQSQVFFLCSPSNTYIPNYRSLLRRQSEVFLQASPSNPKFLETAAASLFNFRGTNESFPPFLGSPLSVTVYMLMGGEY